MKIEKAQEWKSAQVKFIAEGGYGFLDTAQGRIFFHKAGYGVPSIELEPEPHIILGSSSTTPRPKQGEWITYLEGTNEKGIIAQSWCFRDDWNAARYAMNHLPQYRLVYREMVTSQPVQDLQNRCWIQSSEVRESAYDPTYSLKNFAMLLLYRGDDMLRKGQFQLQSYDEMKQTWNVVSVADIRHMMDEDYTKYFADNSLWQHKPGEVLTRKVA